MLVGEGVWSGGLEEEPPQSGTPPNTGARWEVGAGVGVVVVAGRGAGAAGAVATRAAIRPCGT
ncbi:hypothetical protein [Kutzneria sp. NPDC051319]|uniref:hypothetical protein n=1 Tax=Kutzneria sp. NPDC051319 TaxID=3155047 RepID=UPI0034441E22